VDLILFIVLLAVQGLVIGAFARLALPGKDPMSIPATIGIGLAGSFIAGLIFYAVTGGSAAPGFVAALVVSVGIVYVIRRRRGGGLTRPSGSAPERGAFGR